MKKKALPGRKRSGNAKAASPTPDNPKLIDTFREVWGPDFRPPFPWLPQTKKAFEPFHEASGKIISRPTLNLKTRVIIIFSTMVALGYKPEAKLYIQGLRHMGFSIEEIAEMILQVTVYAGLCRGVDANILLSEVVEEDKERAKAKGFYYKPPRM